MAIQTTDAIVLYRNVLGDSSLLVTLYTRDFGKLKVVARGARKPKSKMASAFQPFTLISVTFRRKEHRELQTLSKAEVLSTFRYLGENLTKMAYASAVAELINRLVIGEEPSEELFNLIIQTLNALNHLPEVAGEVVFWRFQLQFATTFGYAPQFSNCIGCVNALKETPVRFSPALGGALCPQCQAQDISAFEISLGTIKLLDRIQKLPLDNLARLRSSKLSRQEIHRMIRAFFLYHMDDARELKALQFLQSLELDQDPASFMAKHTASENQPGTKP